MVQKVTVVKAPGTAKNLFKNRSEQDAAQAADEKLWEDRHSKAIALAKKEKAKAKCQP